MGSKFKRVPVDVPVSELSPLNISCGSTKCESGLHCFTRNQHIAQRKYGKTHVCYECGASLNSWDRLHKRDFRDSAFVFRELKNELIRHVYWHMPIKQRDKINAINDGIVKIKAYTINRLTKIIGIESPFRDGITPYDGNIVFYAQHATASCCRVCMEYWHGIPKGRPLTKEEIEYLTNLIIAYIYERVPELKKEKQKTENGKH
jgi:ribosomal protein L34E